MEALSVVSPIQRQQEATGTCILTHGNYRAAVQCTLLSPVQTFSSSVFSALMADCLPAFLSSIQLIISFPSEGHSHHFGLIRHLSREI